ncbi:MAG: hypothetical protein U0Q19_00525 [Kineosporiaceae bacterium]
MTKRLFDPREVDSHVASHGHVASHAELRAMGVSMATITRRIGVGGPWQRLLPGVVLTHRGTPTRRELLLGARAFCGDEAVITGIDALHAAGLRTLPPRPEIDVLIPAERHRKSHGSVHVERTHRLPDPVVVNGIPYAPVPRALIDTCRRTAVLGDVRHLVATVIQRRSCTVPELADETVAAARARTALARFVLAEVSDGVRSVAEGVARDVMRKGGVPAPEWNVRLILPDGSELTPDAYWPAHGLALEIDSYAWHLAPADYLHTMQRARRMVVGGLLLMSFGPVEITSGPDRFVREVKAMLALAAGRAVPEGIVMLPAA